MGICEQVCDAVYSIRTVDTDETHTETGTHIANTNTKWEFDAAEQKGTVAYDWSINRDIRNDDDDSDNAIAPDDGASKISDRKNITLRTNITLPSGALNPPEFDGTVSAARSAQWEKPSSRNIYRPKKWWEVHVFCVHVFFSCTRYAWMLNQIVVCRILSSAWEHIRMLSTDRNIAFRIDYESLFARNRANTKNMLCSTLNNMLCSALRQNEFHIHMTLMRAYTLALSQVS